MGFRQTALALVLAAPLFAAGSALSQEKGEHVIEIFVYEDEEGNLQTEIYSESELDMNCTDREGFTILVGKNYWRVDPNCGVALAEDPRILDANEQMFALLPLFPEQPAGDTFTQTQIQNFLQKTTSNQNLNTPPVPVSTEVVPGGIIFTPE